MDHTEARQLLDDDILHVNAPNGPNEDREQSHLFTLDERVDCPD